MICILEEEPVRTTLNVDTAALREAMSAAPGKTKTEVINTALRDFARRQRLRDFVELEGKVSWEGDLDALRKRTDAA